MTPATSGLVEWFRPGEHDRVERALEQDHDVLVYDIPSLRENGPNQASGGSHSRCVCVP